MSDAGRWPRILVIAGLVAMLVGAIDPLEGSIVILLGTGLAALGAWLGTSRHRNLLLWAFVLVVIGGGTMWGLSAVRGLGGPTGRSYWWSLILLRYPVGWILGLVGIVRTLRETSKMAAPSGESQLTWRVECPPSPVPSVRPSCASPRADRSHLPPSATKRCSPCGPS